MSDLATLLTWRHWTPLPDCRRDAPESVCQEHHITTQPFCAPCGTQITLLAAVLTLIFGLKLAAYCCPASDAVSGSASLQDAGNVRQSLFTAGAMSLCRPETAELSSSPSELSESLSSLMLPLRMKVATCWDKLCGHKEGQPASQPSATAAAHRRKCVQQNATKAYIRSRYGLPAKTSSFHVALVKWDPASFIDIRRHHYHLHGRAAQRQCHHLSGSDTLEVRRFSAGWQV